MKKLYLVMLQQGDRQPVKLVRAHNETDAVCAALHSCGWWSEWAGDEIGRVWNREARCYIVSVEGEIET